MSKGRYQPKFFRWSEFDSSDAPGSGVNMQDSTLMMLDEARGIYGRPIRVRNGFRTRAKQLQLIKRYGLKHAVETSAHEKGYGADLEAVGLQEAKNMLTALYKAGFRRFGLMETAIHVDNDPARPTPAVWKYPTTSARRESALRAHLKALSKEENKPVQALPQTFGNPEQLPQVPPHLPPPTTNELSQTIETICQTLADHAAKNGIRFTYSVENA